MRVFILHHRCYYYPQPALPSYTCTIAANMDADASLYQLLPLSRTETQIRLIHVQPSADQQEPISCSLSVHTLDESLEFAALSYEWGRFPDKNGEKHTLAVNSNWAL